MEKVITILRGVKGSLIFLALNLIVVSSSGQNDSQLGKEIFECKEVVFYGYDFSDFKLAEGKRIYTTDLLKYIPGWIEYQKEELNENDLAKKLNKESVMFDFGYTLSLIDSLEGKELITLMKHSISPDSIQGKIDNYKTKDNSGIGLVVIVECFEKETEMATAYFVFFDIATKKIISSDYYGLNKPGGFGLSSYWSSGLNKTCLGYFSKVYNKKYVEFLKNEEK